MPEAAFGVNKNETSFIFLKQIGNRRVLNARFSDSDCAERCAFCEATQPTNEV